MDIQPAEPGHGAASATATATAVLEPSPSRAADYDALTCHATVLADQLDQSIDDQVSIARTAQAIENLGRAVQRAQVLIAGRAESSRIHQAQPASSDSPGSSAAHPAGRSAFRNTADYLVALLRISRTEANSRLFTAASVLPRLSLVGTPIPPRRPRMAEVFHSGQASLDGMLSALRPLDLMEPVARQFPGGGEQAMATAEEHLAGKVLSDTPEGIRKDAEKLAQRIDQDGLEPTDELKRASQGLFFRGRYNGLFRIELLTTAEQYEFLKSTCGPENNPRRHGRRTPSPRPVWAPRGIDGAERPETSHTVDQDGRDAEDPIDERTPAQRFLDGLVKATEIALATNRLPRNGGMAPQVFVTIDYESLAGRLATFKDHTSEAVFAGPISPRSIRQLACHADITPLVLGDDGEVLDMGRSRRLFTEVQRKALLVRDGGCVFPGCTVPGTWCEAHHIVPWADGGSTDLRDGVLLCSYHHHLVHAGNWELLVHGNRPHFRPPPDVDHTRTLIRNTYFRQ